MSEHMKSCTAVQNLSSKADGKGENLRKAFIFVGGKDFLEIKRKEKQSSKMQRRY